MMMRQILPFFCLFFLFMFSGAITFAQVPNNGYRIDSLGSTGFLQDSKYWFSYTDKEEGGASHAQRDYSWDSSRSSHVHRLSYALDKGALQWGPFVGFGCNTSGMGAPKDSEGISYAYKGVAHAILFRGSGVNDHGYFRYTVPASRTWKVVTVPFSQLEQPDWAKVVPFQPDLMEGWAWHITGNTGDSGSLSIVDVRLLNLVPVAPQEHHNATEGGPYQSLESIKRLSSVVVVKDNKVLFRKFFNGFDALSPHPIFSEVKSLMAVLIGIAIDNGFIKSVDQPLSDFFPSILVDTSRYKKQITLRHLLNHTSGLPAYEWPDRKEWAYASDPSMYLLSQPLLYIPGKTYQYNSGGTHLLSGVITKATSLPTADFANKYVFQPLGITGYQWAILRDGYYDGAGSSVLFKADDMVKLGTLLLQHGQWNGKRIVSEQWLKQLFPEVYSLKAPWGLKDSYYNFSWYNTTYKGFRVDYAVGYAGQFLFLIPALKAVIVVHHNHEGNQQNNNRQSYLFLEHQFPILFDQLRVGDK